MKPLALFGIVLLTLLVGAVAAEAQTIIMPMDEYQGFIRDRDGNLEPYFVLPPPSRPGFDPAPPSSRWAGPSSSFSERDPYADPQSRSRDILNRPRSPGLEPLDPFDRVDRFGDSPRSRRSR